MKIKHKLIISVFSLILTMLLATKVEAASASISASSKNVTPGTKVTITTTIKGASWQINLSGAVNKTYSDSTSDAEDTTKKTTTFTPSKAGTYKISLSGNVTGSDDTSSTSVSDSVTITVKEKSETNNNNTNNNTTTDTTTTASSDATLSNLGINPNDFSGFRRATTTYNVLVPKATEKISIYATPTAEKATVTGIGSKTLKLGSNTFNIKVTAEDKKTTKTYTLNITRKEVSSDATLSNLGIRPKEYDFTGFRMSKTEYTASVPNDTEKITIYAYASSNKATVTGIGTKTLKEGDNSFQIKVTAEDKKTTKTYNLVVTRKEEEEKPEEDPEENTSNTSTTGVTNIEIGNYDLTPNFTPETYEYNVTIPEAVEKVDVDVETLDGVEAEVVGNEGLKEGENLITILVRDTKTDKTATYQIKAEVAEKTSTEDDTENNTIAAVTTKENFLVKHSGLIKGLIAVIILIIIIFLVKRHKEMQEDYEEDEEIDESQEENEVSETKSFYNQMDRFQDDNEQEDDYEGGLRGRRYRGKRFK